MGSTMFRTSMTAVPCLVMCLQACIITGASAAQAPSDVNARELELGRHTAAYVTSSIGLVRDAALQAYVQQVGEVVALASASPSLPWQFAVLDDPTPNAFALPGGVVFITRGMLLHLETEAQLAAVLGHEIAHIAARHPLQLLGPALVPPHDMRALGVQAEADRPLGGLAVGLEQLFRQYGMQAERHADALGFDYARAAGYDVREIEGILLALQRREGDALPSGRDTHPTAAERLAALRARLAELDAAGDRRIGRDEYMARIDGLVYGQDPRNGFFQGAHFMHPAQRYRVRLPEGWSAQHRGQLALAMAPAGDAVIQLTVEDGDVDAATRQFMELPGLRGRRVVVKPAGGLAATIVTFRIDAGGERRTGIAAFIAHDGRTHRILGVATHERFLLYGAEMVSTIASFQPLDAAAAAAFHELRLRVERIPERMSIERFAERYPGVASVDELVILNQAPGPAATLPAGALLKRVVGGG